MHLANPGGISVDIINYGGIITSVAAPDRHGNIANIVLHKNDLDGYLAGHPMFGCLVGRYANRIAKAVFSLNGKSYKLAANDGRNHLHGGLHGFDKYLWNIDAMKSDPDSASVGLDITSPDGDESYPGELKVSVTFSLTRRNELSIKYIAKTDKPTILNLTSHAYWNLAGAGSGDVLLHNLRINAAEFLPVDSEFIPLGPPAKVFGTAMDFTKSKAIGTNISQVPGGYDFNFILPKHDATKLVPAAEADEPISGRHLEVSTTEPGLQFYTGNGLNKADAKNGGPDYGPHSGFCLEAQHFPDSPHQPSYPSVVLKPGQIYRQETVYKISQR